MAVLRGQAQELREAFRKFREFLGENRVHKNLKLEMANALRTFFVDDEKSPMDSIDIVLALANLTIDRVKNPAQHMQVFRGLVRIYRSPLSTGDFMKAGHAGYKFPTRKLRAGDYRIQWYVKDGNVEILDVIDRKESYRKPNGVYFP